MKKTMNQILEEINYEIKNTIYISYLVQIIGCDTKCISDITSSHSFAHIE